MKTLMTSLISSKAKPLKGQAAIPGDKSISHRSLMLGALVIGETKISGLLEGEDVMHTANAMRAMGAKIINHGDGNWSVNGVGRGCLLEADNPIEMGNSGTSVRLLMGLVAGYHMNTTFQGDASLSKRPMERVMKPLRDMGVRFDAADGGRLPLTVHGAKDLLPIEYRLPVASAQVKSAILLAGLNARGTTTVIEDKPTRDYTENMLRGFGVDVSVEDLEDGAQAISVVGQQEFKPCTIQVPSDPSSAAFVVAAAAIIDGSDVMLPNIGMNDRRAGLFHVLKEMGADITFENERTQGGEKVADLHVKGCAALKGIAVPPDVNPSMIDEFPILFVVAACAQGTTKMTDLGELRVKESDRLGVMAEGLKACGVKLEMGEDSLIIHGTGKPSKGGALIKTALDHRIAMSFLVLGAVSDEPISIDDAMPIQTSFPNFVTLMNNLGAHIGEPEE